MAANLQWTDARLSAQRPADRTLTFPSPGQAPAGASPARSRSARRDLSIPSWVVFCMIMLATFAVCVTVTMRTHAGMRSAEGEFRQVSAEVETLRDGNAKLRLEVERLKEDPRAIESAARERLNMVRSNEVVVPLD
ncbi:MAG TPA: septum formation initiator family protein [Pyrinomonadaceae bacterium]|nr:septum formation initiator family protein [Pyrinomonadaceae bacterium]